MAATETIEDFYKKKFNLVPDNLQHGIGHFNVFNKDTCALPGNAPVTYNRRDFYKISLTRSRNIFHYADKSLETQGPSLLFFSPRIPYTFESVPDDRSDPSGFFCIFTESFINGRNFADLPMFAPGGCPAYSFTKEQDEEISAVFQKMLREIDSDYTELLERQFPIESPSQQFGLRSAKDYASQLAVHINHLNRAVKQTTGKTTTEHITGRVLSEAKALLKHTDWNISMISYCLGFEEPSHFNNFFRKRTQLTPSAFRIV